MRTLLLVPKDMPLAETETKVEALRAILHAIDPGLDAVTSYADWAQWFPFEGSWAAWAQGAASRYDAFFVWADSPESIPLGARRVLVSALSQPNKRAYLWAGADFTPITHIEAGETP